MKNKAAKYVWAGLKSVFAVAALYWVMSPAYIEFDDSQSYEPNEVQKEFLRLAAEQYDYLALGDTDHRRSAISMMVFNTETISAISDAGKENFFLESSPRYQPYYDAVSDKEILDNREDGFYRMANGNGWICEKKVKTIINENFERSAQDNPDVHFIAADARGTEENAFRRFVEEHDWAFGVPLRTYNKIYGCIGIGAFIPVMVLLVVSGNVTEFAELILDDTETSKYISSYGNGGVIFYGAGHFHGSVDKEKSMRTLLQKDGSSLAVIEIYESDKQKDLRNSSDMLPDAKLYVRESKENPDGIIAISDEMKKLEKQANENVLRRSSQPENGLMF